jgi:hypothetical protein
MQQFESPQDIAHALAGRRFVSAEFMHQPRPPAGRERVVFDYALRSRLAQLGERDAVLFICDSSATIDSLAAFQADYPRLTMPATITNPPLWNGAPSDTPRRLGWEAPAAWQRYQMTDRWARLDLALHVASLLDSPGYLILPAHDAVWGRGLLDRLARFSQQQARGGQPAAASPYTYHQHSPVPGADIPQEVIDLLNTAFGRDPLLRWKLQRGRMQGFWGKMGLLPFGLCGTVREHAETFVWEDDLEIDSTLRRLGYNTRALWVSDPAVYCQALPVFDEAGVRRVIERTLHYSLNIPAAHASALTVPLGMLGKLRQWIDPHFAQTNARAEALVADCMAAIHVRLEQFGASWIDWGAYRYVMRASDPAVEVWKKDVR